MSGASVAASLPRWRFPSRTAALVVSEDLRVMIINPLRCCRYGDGRSELVAGHCKAAIKDRRAVNVTGFAQVGGIAEQIGDAGGQSRYGTRTCDSAGLLQHRDQPLTVGPRVSEDAGNQL